MLEEFLGQDPNDSFSRYALALELEKEGRDSEAIEQFLQVAERDPGYVPLYFQLGRVLARVGRSDEARDIYTRGIEAASAAGDEKTGNELQEALSLLS